jgi:nicotinate-nucleotide adenylyltransferase
LRGSRGGKRKIASGRSVALFGGTFDPIHLGHLEVAQTAARRFRLDAVFFIPSAHPPHKPANALLPFAHRMAMVALACAGHPRFVPSIAEAERNGPGRPFYSVDTVRRFRRQFHKPGDRLYFLVGADAFLHIREWKDYETLLGLCDFIVAHRPGFSTDSLKRAIPQRLLAPVKSAAQDGSSRAIALRRTSIYLLDAVNSAVSGTAVRSRLDHGRSIHGLVPRAVEEYISKQSLYA